MLLKLYVLHSEHPLFIFLSVGFWNIACTQHATRHGHGNGNHGTLHTLMEVCSWLKSPTEQLYLLVIYQIVNPRIALLSNFEVLTLLRDLEADHLSRTKTAFRVKKEEEASATPSSFTIPHLEASENLRTVQVEVCRVFYDPQYSLFYHDLRQLAISQETIYQTSLRKKKASRNLSKTSHRMI